MPDISCIRLPMRLGIVSFSIPLCSPAPRSMAVQFPADHSPLEGTGAPDQHDVFMIIARIVDKPSEIGVYDYAGT